MSDDLDKMASELKNMTPSDASRKGGMNAAMAAFEAEFAAEKKAETSASGEKISDPAQGLAREPRPTGQNIRRVRVRTFGTTAMSKLTPLFNINPRAAMMGGSSLAALIAAVVVFQADPIRDHIRPEGPAPVVAIEPDAKTPQTEVSKLEEQKIVEKGEVVAPLIDPKPSQDRSENTANPSNEDVDIADKKVSVEGQTTPVRNHSSNAPNPTES